MRPFLLATVLLASCSSKLTDGFNYVVNGERTGIFRHIRTISCGAGPSGGGTHDITFHFNEGASPVSALFVTTAVVSVAPYERVVYAGQARLLSDQDDLDVVEDFSRFDPVPIAYEMALGQHVPLYLNGEPAALPDVETFVHLMRIGQGAVYVDPNNGETVPIEGMIEDLRMYCTSGLEL